MGESSTSSAMCKVCGHRHRQGDPHIWDSGPAVIGRSSSTVEPVICNHQVEGSIPSSGPKRDSGPMTTITHPVSTNIPATAVTATDGDMTWVEAMPWRRPLTASDKDVGFDIDGIPVEPFVNIPVNNSVNNVSSVNNANVNKSKDRKTYMKEYMKKRRAPA